MHTERKGIQDGPTMPITWPVLLLLLAFIVAFATPTMAESPRERVVVEVLQGIEDGPDPVVMSAIIDDGVSAVGTISEECDENGDNCVIVPEVACDGIVECATAALLNCTGNGGANASWLAEDVASTHNGNACKFRCNDNTIKRVRCLKIKRPAPMPPDVGF